MMQQQTKQERPASERYEEQKQTDPLVNADRISAEAQAVLERTNTVEESRAQVSGGAAGAVRDVRIDASKGASAREVGEVAVGQAMIDVDRRHAGLKVPMALDDTHFIRDEVRRAILNAAREIEKKEARAEHEQQLKQNDLKGQRAHASKNDLFGSKERHGERAAQDS